MISLKLHPASGMHDALIISAAVLLAAVATIWYGARQ
jgi:hypothetical protein